MLAVVLAQLVLDLGLALFDLDPGHGGAEDEFQPLFRQDPLELLLHLAVHAGGDGVEELDHRHLAPSRA